MKRIATFGALALLALAPATLSAQSVADDEAAVKFERAELLTEQAYLAAGQQMDYTRAATWLRDAAALRDQDAESVRLLIDAGHFHFYDRRSAKAMDAFFTAGKLALELGERELAALAFRNAAHAAGRVGDAETATAMIALSQRIEVEATVAQAEVAFFQDR